MLELAVRLPNGQRTQRRFLNSDSVAAVETWLRHEGQDMNGRMLSRQWPRKVSTSNFIPLACHHFTGVMSATPMLVLLVQLLSDGMQTLEAAGLERNEMLVLVQRP